ncbi:SNF2 family N-terminal domain containing protein [Rhypophila sp. PSN 637]
MSEAIPMDTDMGPEPTGSHSEETKSLSFVFDLVSETQTLIPAVSPETAEIFDSFITNLTGERPYEEEEPNTTDTEADAKKPIDDDFKMNKNSRDDDADSSSVERAIKRQRLSEEVAEANEAGPSNAVDARSHSPVVKVKIPPEEELTDLEWAREGINGRIAQLRGNLNPPILKDVPTVKDEGDAKEEEKKVEVMNMEESPEEKRTSTPPKKQAKKKTKPSLNPSGEWWAIYYKEEKGEKGEKGGPKKKKLKAGTSFTDMVKNSNSSEARAARGELQLAGPIEATNAKDEAIKRMTGPNAGRGDISELVFAIQSFGRGQVKPDPAGAKWKLAGIKSPLFNHQVTGVSMMLSKEFSPGYGPKGGILGDEMGFGKTLQTIAMMRCNRPNKADRKRKKHTTLIVALASAVHQWKEEIKKHVEAKEEKEPTTFDLDDLDADDDEDDETGFSAITQYKKRNLDPYDDSWKKADVIVTSYHEIAAALPDKVTMQVIKAGKLSPEKEKDLIIKKSRGEILRKQYYRIVLDEGHAIKNWESDTCKACLLLDAKYKWILTGTPMHNSSEELFPYFAFLGIDPGVGPERLHTGKGKIKANRPQKDTNPAAYRAALNEALQSVMIRRHVDDKFLGHEILQIPQNHPTEIVKVELPATELLLYKQLESCYNAIMGEQKQQKGTTENLLKGFILIAITRLRQAISHPYLLEEVLCMILTTEDFEELEAKFAAAGDETPANSRIRKLLKNERKLLEEYESSILPSSEGAMQAVIDSDPLGSVAMKDEDINDILCGVCKQLPDDLVNTKRKHIFCSECLAAKAKINGCKCPECGASLDEADLPEDFEEDGEDTASFQNESPSKASKKGRGRAKGKGKGKTREKKHGEDELFFQPSMARLLSHVTAYDKEYARDSDKKMVDGAKVLAVKNHILKWQAEAPDDKIIAFTQHAGTAAILGRVLAEEDIQFVQFWGELSMTKKQNALIKFREDPKVKVMIASLKCGGQALNLTCANRVIIIDPWWNSAMEKQAFGRVARIGQHKETYLAKFVAEKTIEVDMVNLQYKKAEDIALTLKEKARASGGNDFATKLLGGLIGLQMKSGQRGGEKKKGKDGKGKGKVGRK